MINSFLVSLYNSGTAPTNPSSTVGDVLWPGTVQVKTYTGNEELAERILFDGVAAPSLDRFLTAIQLLWVVQDSVLVNHITADDPRVTYTDEQLIGQFEGATHDNQQVTRVLGEIASASPLTFLGGELLSTYRTALSPLDRLAAVICHFGKRDD